MKQLNVIELRNSKGRLIAKYYPDRGRIVIKHKGLYSIVIVPPGTDVKFLPDAVPLTK